MSNDNQEQDLIGVTDDERRVAEMLGSLKRVEAPGDFDARVRARIAQGRPSSSNGTWLPQWARYGVPLALVVVVGGYFAIDRYSRTTVNAPAETARTEFTQTAAPQAGNIAPPANTASTAAVPESEPAMTAAREVTPAERRSKPRTDTDGDTPGGGSFVEAVKPGKRLLPKGIDPNAIQPGRPRDFDPNAKIPVTEVLTVIGVKANFAGSNWTVESVVDHSAAGDAGIKPGDVIDTINEQKLSEKTAFNGKFTGRSIRVLRGGKPVMIDLIKK
jgi:membrane-associated protease RseP (regulator of RpoE activity)